jgi:hypothetical protein
MKTRIKYVDVSTLDGGILADILIAQGWKIASHTPYGITFYKIYLK